MSADGTEIERLIARQDSFNIDPDWQAVVS
jgi:hypothetical protein